MLSNANENWYVILYDLFSWLWYIATCGPFCKDATHIIIQIEYINHTNNIVYSTLPLSKYTYGAYLILQAPERHIVKMPYSTHHWFRFLKAISNHLQI